MSQDSPLKGRDCDRTRPAGEGRAGHVSVARRVLGDVSVARGHRGTCLWQKTIDGRVLSMARDHRGTCLVYGKRPGEATTSSGLVGKLLTGTARLATGSYSLPAQGSCYV